MGTDDPSIVKSDESQIQIKRLFDNLSKENFTVFVDNIWKTLILQLFDILTIRRLFCNFIYKKRLFETEYQ